jgi:hypothetical protein
MTVGKARCSVLLAADPADRLANPYLRILFGSGVLARQARVRRFRPGRPQRGVSDVHLHWPEYLLHGALCRRSAIATDLAYRHLLSTIDRSRAAGARLVWTAHNLEPHSFPSPHAEAAYNRWAPRLFARVDTVVVMAPSVEASIRAAIPAVDAARFVHIPHPHYRGIYRSPADRAAVRERFGIPAGAHLTVAAGLVRGYKRVPELIDAFVAAARDDEYLLVAGSCHEPDLARAVLARSADRVLVDLRRLEDAGYADIVAEADLFVGNFASVLNSGSVLAALSLDTPVLAPALGALADLREQVGPDWLTLFDGPLDASALRRHIDRIREVAPTGSPDLERNDPWRVARSTLDLYTLRSPFPS